MTLGIVKIAAVLEKAGVTVDKLDLSGVENFEYVVHNYAKSPNTTFYGLTATTPQMAATTKIQKTIREVQPDARII